MKKLTITIIATAVIVPQMTLAMTFNGHFPFVHRSKPLNANVQTINVNDATLNANSHTNGETTMPLLIKGRLQTVITTQLSRIEKLQTVINARSAMPAEIKATVLADLASDTTFFAAEQIELKNASTLDDIKTIGQALREYLSQREQRVAHSKTLFADKALVASTKAQQIGNQLVAKLEHISSGLQGHAIDTTELNTQIATLKTDVAALSNIDTTNGPATLRDAIANIRTEIHTIISTIKSLVQNA